MAVETDQSILIGGPIRNCYRFEKCVHLSRFALPFSDCDESDGESFEDDESFDELSDDDVSDSSLSAIEFCDVKNVAIVELLSVIGMSFCFFILTIFLCQLFCQQFLVKFFFTFFSDFFRFNSSVQNLEVIIVVADFNLYRRVEFFAFLDGKFF